jgi:hypothetical protein
MIVADEIRPAAFMRRAPHPETGEKRDVDGLSVALAGGRDEITTAEAEAGRFNRCEAVCRITTGSVRSVETKPHLDVVQDEPFHANITGLPEMPGDIETEAGRAVKARAEFLGGELARRAHIVWRRPRVG